MGVIASQITSLTMIVYSNVYSDADQRKNQSSASLAFVRGIHRGPVNSPHKWPVTWKMFPFDDVIMTINFLTPRRCDTDFAKPICTPCWKPGAAFDPLHIDSLWANDTIWRHSSGSTLAQVIARCLKTPCWKRGAAFDPLHIDSLWANDAIWRHSSGSTLAQVIARETPCWKHGAAFDPLHIDSLWANDAIWRQSSGSTLAQVIARCLKTPSHYLNQCRLIITRVLWRSLKSNSTKKGPWT